MERIYWSLILFLSLLACRTGSSESPAPEAGPEGAVSWWDCEFGPAPGRDKIRMLIMTIGNRVERALVEPLGLTAVDASQLKVSGRNLTGKLIIGHDQLRMNRSLVPRLSTRLPLTLDLVHQNGKVSGTVDGSWPRLKNGIEKVHGAVKGTRHEESRLKKANSLADGASWPGWLGPDQNFSAPPGKVNHSTSLQQARLCWVSQWIGPTESGSKRYGACVGAPPCAGGASPLVWNGRVYQFRYQASGDEYQKHLDDQLAGERGVEIRQKMKAIGWTMADMRRRWAIHADEQLVCLDAATGRTLWTVTWPREGINLYDHKCSLTNHTGVIANGNVYVFGAMGIVRCVEADTGRVRWSTPLPGYFETMTKLKTRALARRDLNAPTRSFCHALNVSGDTVVAPDGIGSCGVVGLDASSGKVLWRVPRVLGKAATPMAWRHHGRHFVIAANEQGVIACIDARNGKLVWKYDEAGDNEYQTLLVGDWLVGHKLKREEREKAPRARDDGIHSAPGSNFGQVACWRLTLDGPKPVWQAPDRWGAPSSCPIGSTAGGLICFRGNYSYYLVKPETGERVASRHLPTAVRWDEGHLLAVPGAFVLHPDSQHGHTKMFLFPARADGTVGPMWSPPHPHATTYQSAMSHAWVDGRLFIRGADALYCYDLRR